MKGKKIAYGYQLAAFSSFGRSEMIKVSSVKSEADALTVSHICGTRNCCQPNHLEI